MARRHIHPFGLKALIVGLISSAVAAVLISPAAANGTVYDLAPGDRVAIKVFDDDQLSGSYSIDGAGMVTLPIVGSIKLSGLSLEGSQKAIEERLSQGYYTRPVVSVRVEDYRAVYVHGQVRSPGAYPFRVGLTPVGAMVLAGGAPNPAATALALTADLNAADERVNIQRQRKAQLELRIAALEAERDNVRTLEMAKLPPDLMEHPGIEELLAIEQRQLDTDVSSLDNEVSVLEKQRPQFQAELSAIEIELAAQDKLLGMARQREGDLTELLKKGLARRSAQMEPAQQSALAETSIARLRSAKSRNEIESGALELKIVEKKNLFRQRALSQLAEARRNLADADIQLKHAVATRDLRRQAMGPGALTASPIYIITRMTADQPQVFEATISTPVEPGDVVEVRYPSLMGSEALIPGSEPSPKHAEDPSSLDGPPKRADEPSAVMAPRKQAQLPETRQPLQKEPGVRNVSSRVAARPRPARSHDVHVRFAAQGRPGARARTVVTVQDVAGNRYLRRLAMSGE